MLINRGAIQSSAVIDAIKNAQNCNVSVVRNMIEVLSAVLVFNPLAIALAL